MSNKLKLIIIVQLFVIGILGFNFWENRVGEVMGTFNPVSYFEIPVSDLNRAMKFYNSVFNYDFEVEEIHGNRMALFPFAKDGTGISGALAQGEIYQPTIAGTLIYFSVKNIEETILKTEKAGGSVLFPKTKAGEYGFVAEIKDSEGNRIGLSER